MQSHKFYGSRAKDTKSICCSENMMIMMKNDVFLKDFRTISLEGDHRNITPVSLVSVEGKSYLVGCLPRACKTASCKDMRVSFFLKRVTEATTS